MDTLMVAAEGGAEPGQRGPPHDVYRRMGTYRPDLEDAVFGNDPGSALRIGLIQQRA